MKSKFAFDISIPEFTLSICGRELVKKSKLLINSGKFYVLFGNNGTGKSTFLNKLSKREEPFCNSLDERISMFLVEQEFTVTDKSVFDTVIESDLLMKELKEEENEILKRYDDGIENDNDHIRLEEIYDKLNFIQSDRAESKVKSILHGLQFTKKMMESSATIFSGGWRMRISLARALFLEPKLLLLDEPTNHLDLHASIWLQNYIKLYPHTLIIVSHDYDFINNVATDIIHIWNKQLFHYKGRKEIIEKKNKKSRKRNLDVLEIYSKELENKINNYNEAYEKQQKLINKLKRQHKDYIKELEDMREKNKNKNNSLFINSDELILPRLKLNKISINFNCNTFLSNAHININNIYCGYNNVPVLNDVNFNFLYTDKIAIVGTNGSGKTTFINSIIETYKKEKKNIIIKGDIELPANMRIGIFNQFTVDYLDFDDNSVNYLCKKYNLQIQEARKYLGSYGLESKYHYVNLKDLSGGQKSRIVFIELELVKPHFMLLDEPTNNLDMETIDALKIALEKYRGGFIMITHHLDIINLLCNKIIICQDNELNEYDYSIYDYCEEILEQLEK